MNEIVKIQLAQTSSSVTQHLSFSFSFSFSVKEDVFYYLIHQSIILLMIHQTIILLMIHQNILLLLLQMMILGCSTRILKQQTNKLTPSNRKYTKCLTDQTKPTKYKTIIVVSLDLILNIIIGL